MTRERKVKLTDDSVENVKVFATTRLNKAIHAIKVFGNCCGSKYSWEPEQIEKAETALYETVEQVVKDIREGKQITDAGITL